MKKFILSISCFILLIPFLAYGQDDIYAVKTPNVMIIFDTSNSMEQKPDGWGQGEGWAKGVDGNWYNFEGKGNHPGSKLYQAKKALKADCSISGSGSSEFRVFHLCTIKNA